MKLKILPLIIAAVIIAVPLALVDSDVQADDSGTFEVTDGTGETFVFEGASEHVVTGGVGATLTVADCGAIDKIVAADKYSMYDYYGYEQLKNLNAVDLGTFYSTSNHGYIEAELLRLVSEGVMGLDDAIILTTYTYNLELREMLEEDGFTHVLVWIDVDTFDAIAEFVDDLSMIATGSVTGGAAEMNEKITYVETVASTIPDDEKANAIVLWYTSGTGEFQITNLGIAASMLDKCNANNIGYKDNGSQYYGSIEEALKILEDYPGAVIFLNDSWSSAGYSVDDFRDKYLGGSNDYTVIQMTNLWNNWCPESADGLLSMASALYPDYFGEYDGGSSGGSDDDDNNLIWWAVAIIIVIIIIIILAWYLYRQRTH